jgi:hypothetical protein
MNLVKQWFEITFILVLVYLILSHGDAFSKAIYAITGLYTGSVKSLQGR